MIKNILYKVTRVSISFSFLVYVKHFDVIRAYKEKKRDNLIYASTHNNSFQDAFSIIFSQKRIPIFLTRGGIFGSKIGDFFLDTYKMFPIYRKRDGVKAVIKNNEIFQKSIEVIKEGKYTLSLFPEGNHSMKLGVRPLQKGITRLAFETLEKYPDLDLKIIPVGLNYSNYMSFQSNVLVLKGPPIYVKPFYDIYLENKVQASKELLDKLSAEMQKLCLYIPPDRYDEIHSLYLKYRVHGNDLKVNFENDKKLLENLINGTIPSEVPKQKSKLPLYFRRFISFPIGLFTWLINLFPFLISEWIVKNKVSDKHFIDSIRVSIGGLLFPLFYLFYAYIFYFIFQDVWIALAFFLIMPFLTRFYFRFLYKAD